MNIESPRKKLDLASAIAEGDIRVLLMVLVHMTGDMRWLEPPYKPRRDVRLIPDPDAGVPKEIQDEIRAAVLKLFADGAPQARHHRSRQRADAEDDARHARRERHARICAADAGRDGIYSPRDALDASVPPTRSLPQQHVLIVGAGVCAIALGVALGRLGIPYTIVEKNAEIGGTWYVNRYPGCGVDTPNHSYSFSFGARNPWTRYFAQRRNCTTIS